MLLQLPSRYKLATLTFAIDGGLLEDLARVADSTMTGMRSIKARVRR